MNDVFPKFIVEGDCLVIAKCTFHKQLVNIKENVKGGGWWRMNEETKTIIFNGQSEDFGKASIEDIKACIEKKNVFTNKYNTHSIADDFNFSYDTGSEIIELKEMIIN